MDTTIITIFVFVLIAIFWYVSKLPKSDKAGRVTLSKSELEELEAIEKRVAEKTTPVPFAQFSLNPKFQCHVCKEVSKTDDHHQVIFCSYCRTPHHVNCYKEIGHCSVYGCDGQKDPATYQMPCECP